MTNVSAPGAAGETTPIQQPGAEGAAQTPAEKAALGALALANLPNIDPKMKQQLEDDAAKVTSTHPEDQQQALADLGKVSTGVLLAVGPSLDPQSPTTLAALAGWANIQLAQTAPAPDSARETTLLHGLQALSDPSSASEGLQLLSTLLLGDAVEHKIPLGPSPGSVTPDKTIKHTKADMDAAKADLRAQIEAMGQAAGLPPLTPITPRPITPPDMTTFPPLSPDLLAAAGLPPDQVTALTGKPYEQQIRAIVQYQAGHNIIGG